MVARTCASQPLQELCYGHRAPRQYSFQLQPVTPGPTSSRLPAAVTPAAEVGKGPLLPNAGRSQRDTSAQGLGLAEIFSELHCGLRLFPTQPLLSSFLSQEAFTSV